MGLMIRYHDPRRPGDSIITMISGKGMAVAAINRLEEHGFVVDRITVSSPRFARPRLAHRSGSRALSSAEP
jgi:hypothetical protein